MRTKIAFKAKKKIIFFFIIFEKLSVARNYLRPESAPLISMVAILMMSAKLATVDLFKIKVF